jgi:tetratricopeptide (TPR) repeat protein
MLSPCSIFGLVSKPQLNGRSGSALSYDLVSLRYIVQIDGEDEPLKLKPENVLMLADANTVTTHAALVQKHGQLMLHLATAESSGNRAHEAAFCSEVGTVLKNMQHYEAATQYHRRAIDITIELQSTAPEEKMHRIDEGTFRSNLGICMRRLGLLESAVGSLKHALEIAEEAVSTANTDLLTRQALVAQGMARGNLGATYTSLGSRDDDQSTHELAIEVLERGLAITQQVGHAALERNILGNLANAHSALQNCIQSKKPDLAGRARPSEAAGREVALKFSEESLALKRKAGDQRGVASSLHSSGALLCQMGQLAKGKQHLEEALTIADSLM